MSKLIGTFALILTLSGSIARVDTQLGPGTLLDAALLEDGRTATLLYQALPYGPGVKLVVTDAVGAQLTDTVALPAEAPLRMRVGACGDRVVLWLQTAAGVWQHAWRVVGAGEACGGLSHEVTLPTSIYLPLVSGR